MTPHRRADVSWLDFGREEKTTIPRYADIMKTQMTEIIQLRTTTTQFPKRCATTNLGPKPAAPGHPRSDSAHQAKQCRCPHTHTHPTHSSQPTIYPKSPSSIHHTSNSLSIVIVSANAACAPRLLCASVRQCTQLSVSQQQLYHSISTNTNVLRVVYIRSYSILSPHHPPVLFLSVVYFTFWYLHYFPEQSDSQITITLPHRRQMLFDVHPRRLMWCVCTNCHPARQYRNALYGQAG